MWPNRTQCWRVNRSVHQVDSRIDDRIDRSVLVGKRCLLEGYAAAGLLASADGEHGVSAEWADSVDHRLSVFQSDRSDVLDLAPSVASHAVAARSWCKYVHRFSSGMGRRHNTAQGDRAGASSSVARPANPRPSSVRTYNWPVGTDCQRPRSQRAPSVSANPVVPGDRRLRIISKRFASAIAYISHSADDPRTRPSFELHHREFSGDVFAKGHRRHVEYRESTGCRLVSRRRPPHVFCGAATSMCSFTTFRQALREELASFRTSANTSSSFGQNSNYLRSIGDHGGFETISRKVRAE
jgi:hypothetical protein